jgi:ABC-2 type transport system permease protein
MAGNTQVQKSGLLWSLSDCWLMTRRSILHIIRSLDQVMSLIMFPIMFMLLNRYVLGGAIDTGNLTYVNYLFAGILVQTLAFGANYTTINLAVDLKAGIVDRFRSLPMASGSLIIGHIIADLVRNIISGVIIILVGFLVGFRPNANLNDWLVVFGLAMLFSLAISWLSAIMGLLVKTLEAAQWMGFVIIFPLTFISSAFVPTETMPSALRALLVDAPMGNSGWLAVIWLLAIIAVCMPIAIAIFNRRTK